MENTPYILIKSEDFMFTYINYKTHDVVAFNWLSIVIGGFMLLFWLYVLFEFMIVRVQGNSHLIEEGQFPVYVMFFFQIVLTVVLIIM